MISKIPLIVVLLIVCLIPSRGAEKNKELSVVLRQIGHRLLLSSGDSTSRVLPVKMINNQTFEISFENRIHVTADSLYKIAEKELSGAGFYDFVAELKQCSTNEVFLSFMFSKSRDTITPCGGRNLPVGCYTVEITILKKKRMIWMMWILIPLIMVPFATYVLKKSKKSSELQSKSDSLLSLGNYQLDINERKLLHPEENENLTEKELRLLTLLLEGIGEIQNRDFLMKEIWADSGLIVVSKNLDVLVSKIRKKLSRDERIKITNVHGVGYKLEVLM
ncbi:MAG: response regulator transcription factor [Saprospiraceae bacterium]|nr:response regulator transcription factor [Saprospiraceae bacterium]